MCNTTVLCYCVCACGHPCYDVIYDVTGFNNTVSTMCTRREVRCTMGDRRWSHTECANDPRTTSQVVTRVQNGIAQFNVYI